MQNLLDDLEWMLHRVDDFVFLNYCEIDDADFEVSKGDKKLNHAFYGLKK